MNAKIDWKYPEPRKGLAGAWDKFIGPGATVTEQLLVIIPSAVFSLFIVAHAYISQIGWSISQCIIAALLAFDIGGGVTANATSSAKRWYHRSGQGFKQHFGFIALHVFHIFLVALLFRDFDITFLSVIYLYLLTSAGLVLLVPLYIQRSVALLLTCGAIVLSQFIVLPTNGLQWFVPFLFIKLLVSLLVWEEPYAE